MSNNLWRQLLRAASDAVLRSLQSSHEVRPTPSPDGPKPKPRPKTPQASFDVDAINRSQCGYPGDFPGRPTISYDPFDDDIADPGEVVWTWVPYEEDHSQGKDRPVLVIGRDGTWLLALQVTSQDHDRDQRQENAAGRYWIDIGTGAWDNRRRPSEARVNRIIRIAPDEVRRIGSVLPRETFARVAAEVLRHAPGQ